MKKYLLISSILIVLTSCTANDSFFGNDMLPPNQEMYTSIDSNMTLETYVISLDSVPSTDKAGGQVGSTLNQFVGLTDVGFLASYSPKSSDSHRYFGKELHTDSMTLTVRFDQSLIDDKNPIEISLYEVENIHLRHDKLYFSNFDPTPYYNPSKPLAKFVYLKDNKSLIDSVRVSLPRWFFEKFVKPEYLEEKPESPYYADTMFNKTFNGLYFRATPISSGRGNVVNISVEDCDMKLYYRINTSAQRPDTLIRNFVFYSTVLAPYNTTVIVAKHDYTKADPSQGGVRVSQINDTINQASFCYMQGLGGLGARVRLDTAYLRGLNEMAVRKGYTSVALHKAEIKWLVPQINMTYYTDAYSRLGLFSWSNGKFGFIPDYDPISEENGIYTTDFGTFKMSKGYYTMDVTSSVQRLLSGRSTICEFNMAPEYAQFMSPRRSVVGGSINSDGAKPQIILTYTLVK